MRPPRRLHSERVECLHAPGGGAPMLKDGVRALLRELENKWATARATEDDEILETLETAKPPASRLLGGALARYLEALVATPRLSLRPTESAIHGRCISFLFVAT